MKSLITEPLGLYGWNKAEPVLLAALLSEEPLLLVGPHGCAKSFVLERLAESLGMAYRFYNASLINYDDLVGVPLPDATRTKLEYLASPESIWDAEVVFIDEINRTRPELQNKLFPIIYDRRVQGRPLGRLVYRWAAMNPPPTEEDYERDEILYAGAEPLDAALADRFPFIVSVPDWEELSDSDRARVLSDQFEGRHEFPVAIGELVEEARACYGELVPSLSKALSPFIMALVPKLHSARFDVSTRRATMLLRCAIAVHAARVVLARHAGGEEPQLYDSVLLAVQNTLPDRARRRIPASEIVAMCKMVWELVSLDDADPMRSLLLVVDPVKRLRKMISDRLVVSADHIASIVGDAIANAKPLRRRALALATYAALRDNTAVPATTMELLAREVRPVLAPADEMVMVTMQKSRIGRFIATRVETVNRCYGANSELAQFHANLLNSFLPDGYPDGQSVQTLSEFFETVWKEFHL